MNTVVSLTGSPYESNDGGRPAINRTGSALTKYGVYQVDKQAIASESTVAAVIVPSACDNHVIGVTTAGIARGSFVVAQGATADDDTGLFVEGDGKVCKALANGTTDITYGDALSVANGTNYFVKVTSGRYHAIARQTYTTDATAAIQIELLSSGKTL